VIPYFGQLSDDCNPRGVTGPGYIRNELQVRTPPGAVSACSINDIQISLLILDDGMYVFECISGFRI